MTVYGDTPVDAIAIAIARRPDLWEHDLEIRWSTHGWTCKIMDEIAKKQDPSEGPKT